MAKRVTLFAITNALVLGAGLTYFLLSPHRANSADVDAAPATIAAPGAAPGGTAVGDLPKPRLVFRTTALGPDYGKVGVVQLTDAAAAARHLALSCERVHFASGTGICLTADRGVFTTYHAYIFDDAGVRHRLRLEGIPSRARVSPDGRRAAFTIFVSGDSYESSHFSTRTYIVDAAAGKPLGQLEEFTVYRDGVLFKEIDFNFWGVTFTRDGNGFYATLATGGKTYLVKGDVDSRTARTITTDVECPSLSPDNTRIAFKRKPRGGGASYLHVLSLDTLAVTPLAETRGVDDQAEWVDDAGLLYALPNGDGTSTLWTVAADGTGGPVVMRVNAFSPAVVR